MRSAATTAEHDAATPAASSHHQVVRKSVTASSIRVGSGSLASRLSKNTLNLGSTKAASTMTVTMDMTATAVG